MFEIMPRFVVNKEAVWYNFTVKTVPEVFMKKRIGKRISFFEKIRSADPHAAMRFLAAALIFAVIAVVLLFVSSNRTNKQMREKCFAT